MPDEGEALVAVAPDSSSNVEQGTVGTIASQSLDELLAQGKIGPDKAARLKAAYAKLQETLSDTRARESELLQKAKGLNQDLQLQRSELEQKGDYVLEDTSQSGELRRELLRTSNELSLATAREEELQEQAAQLELEHEQVSRELSRVKDNAPLMDPETMTVKKAIEEIQQEITQRKTEIELLTKQVAEKKERIETCKSSNEAIKAEYETLKEVKVVANTEPSRIANQARVFKAAGSKAEEKIASVSETDQRLREELEQMYAKRDELEKELNGLGDGKEQVIQQTEATQRVGQVLAKSLETSKDAQSDAAAERVIIDGKYKRVDKEVKALQEKMVLLARTKDKQLRALRQSEIRLSHLEDLAAVEQRKVDELNLTLQAKKREANDFTNIVPQANKDFEVATRQWESKQGAGNQAVLKVQQAQAANRDLMVNEGAAREELRKAVWLVHQQEVALNQAASDRLRVQSNYAKAKEQLNHQQLIVRDNTKTLDQTVKSLKDLEAMYQVIKTEKNKCTSQINAAAQRYGEMKEKSKILTNETEILRSTVQEKHNKLQRRRIENQTSASARDGIRGELTHLKLKEQQLRSERKGLATENKKLLEMIERAEAKVLQLRDEYRNAVQDRNDLAERVIGRHSELCSFYEKQSTQDGIIRNADLELQNRDEDIKFLRLEISKEKHKLTLLRKQLPKKKQLEDELVAKQIELLETQEYEKQLEEKLHTPANETRWRKLSKGPQVEADPKELEQKLQKVEARLHSKQELLFEKDLVEEEINNLLLKAKKELEGNSRKNVKVSENLNSYQGKIRDMNKKLMALVSELSMNQALSLQLQQDVQDSQNELDQMALNLQSGAAPNEAAEREWARIQRHQAQAQQRRTLKEFGVEDESEGLELQGGGRTYAPQRANAYVPEGDDLGIPKPFTHAPFRPSETGASRLMRKPAPKPLESDFSTAQ